MSTRGATTASFPSAQLALRDGAMPVDISLVAQLGRGEGSQAYAATLARQRAHPEFVDALDEPSTRLAGPDFSRNDPTALFSFSVGPDGHPFHRHAGHRIFTAISGSAGALLRFSGADDDQLRADPDQFIEQMEIVSIPPDCLFTVRFGGGTWHQFVPGIERSGHPALFALSCHTNELGGDLTDATRLAVLAGEATVPSLTELLPDAVASRLRETDACARVPVTWLALDHPPHGPIARTCGIARRTLGRARAAITRRIAPSGYRESRHDEVSEIPLPASSLLRQAHATARAQHEDAFSMRLDPIDVGGRAPAALLAALLDGFRDCPPKGVAHLMQLRNVLVRPFRLRTSPLGCPVSSLLADDAPSRFAGHPVLDQALDPLTGGAEVLLGADDRHLVFRTCVSVVVAQDGSARVGLASRVQCRNGFGRLYMAAISRTHSAYVAPTMLRSAVDHLRRTSPTAAPAGSAPRNAPHAGLRSGFSFSAAPAPAPSASPG